MKNIRDSYKLYKTNNKNIVALNTYIKITTLYLKFILNKVYNNYEVTLPERLGTLKVVGINQKIKVDKDGKISGLSPNWRKTKELWNTCDTCKEKKQLVYNTNEHSSGVRYKFFWSKKRVLIMNKTLYSLRMVRSVKRELHKIILKGKEYI